MAYRDPEKQKQAKREWARRKRAEGSTKGSTFEGSTQQGSTDQIQVIPGKCWCCGSDVPDGTVCCGPCAWSGRAERERAGRKPTRLKRGTDIKTFKDLPLDVQQAIDSISKDAEDKAKRTAGAICYQHLFPDRYESTGLN